MLLESAVLLLYLKILGEGGVWAPSAFPLPQFCSKSLQDQTAHKWEMDKLCLVPKTSKGSEISAIILFVSLLYSHRNSAVFFIVKYPGKLQSKVVLSLPVQSWLS